MNATDGSRRIRTEERDEALAVAGASVKARRAVSVEYLVRKPVSVKWVVLMEKI